MRTAVIWGATGTGKNVYEEVKNKYSIQYFVDGNPNLIGECVKGFEIKACEAIFETKPDVIILGILTGYEEAEKYLVKNGYQEESIISKYIDLSIRARRDCLEKISIIFHEKHIRGDCPKTSGLTL